MKIVAFAYSCEPDEGSEPGAGWMWSRLLAHLGETWVITRQNNRELIEEHLSEIPERDSLHFEFVDLPEWARRWKKGTRGLRLYYPLWQMAAWSRARKLDKRHGFDLSWHLTLANIWAGSVAGFVGRKFIYGPVGGGVPGSWRLLRALGPAGIRSEIVRAFSRTTARYLNPLARAAWQRAELIFVQNPETRDWLPAKHRHKAEVLPHVIFDNERRAQYMGRPQDVVSERRQRAMFAGRLLPWKGGVLALEAIARLPEWQLDICGTGPEESRLKLLSKQLGITERVTFHGWVPRNELLKFMETTGVFLLPSMHDEAGWVVVEALSLGVPVVCLDRGGPPLLGGTAVPITTIGNTIHMLAQAIVESTRRTPAVPPTLESVLAQVTQEFRAAGLKGEDD